MDPQNDPGYWGGFQVLGPKKDIKTGWIGSNRHQGWFIVTTRNMILLVRDLNLNHHLPRTSILDLFVVDLKDGDTMNQDCYKSPKPPTSINKKPCSKLVGGWTNPFEKYVRQIGSWNPRDPGWKFKKYLSCHHLENPLKPPEDFLSPWRFGSTRPLCWRFFFRANRGADLRTESGQVRFEKNTKNHQSHSDIEGYNHSNSVPSFGGS